MKAIAAVTAALALTLPAALSAAPERTAALRLTAAHPVSLRGSRFLPDERVTVVAHSQGRIRTQTVVAADAGTFAVRFSRMPFDRCEGFLAVARGTLGSVAVYKLPDLMCAPRR